MSESDISYQSLLVAKESSRWAYYALWIYGVTALIGLVSALVTLWAVTVAKRGLSTWKDQHISIAKAEWVASLVSYVAGLSYLPDLVDWGQEEDRQHIEKIAAFHYECVKRWKILQVHLSQNPKLEKEFQDKYNGPWVHFGMDSHNAYMSGKISRNQLRDICINLYNL